MSYTKGPWKLVKKTTPGEFGTAYHIRNNDNYMIAEIGPNAQDANSALIAAAPDMFEALNSVFLRCTFENVSDWREERRVIGEIIGSALKKAEGKS